MQNSSTVKKPMSIRRPEVTLASKPMLYFENQYGYQRLSYVILQDENHALYLYCLLGRT